MWSLFSLLQVNTPYATPMSEVQKSADSAVGHEQIDSPTIDQHYVYSLRDFQPFESATYQGTCCKNIVYHKAIIMPQLKILSCHFLTDWLQVS